MAHYALSELAIVLAGLWAARRVHRAGQGAAMLAIALFSFAAFIGVIRFGLSPLFDTLPARLADMHRFFGTIGGTAAMAALCYQLVYQPSQQALAPTADTTPSPVSQNLYLLVATLLLGLALAIPGLGVPSFLIYSLAFIFLAVRRHGALARPAWQVAAMAGFMLANVVLFRQAAWLSPAMSWHIFHLLTAVWVGLLGLLFGPLKPRAGAPL